MARCSSLQACGWMCQGGAEQDLGYTKKAEIIGHMLRSLANIVSAAAVAATLIIGPAEIDEAAEKLEAACRSFGK